MRREIKTSTGRLLDGSDLTVAAPIKPGLVPSLDAVSYKTRAERVLQLLQLGRLGQHEFELTRVLSDAVERVGLIHAVRVGIIEPQNLLMLSVTFDGDWEPYMRTVWQKVARLLDLIFCHTEDYTFGWESSYDEWMRWLRSRQVNTPFLYSQPGLTFADGNLLRSQEWLQRQEADQEVQSRLIHVTHADHVEFQLGTGDKGDPRFPCSLGYATERGGDYLIARQSLRSLAALYRMTDVFLPGTHDGLVLQRAGREALAMLTDLIDGGSLPPSELLEQRFTDAIEWLQAREPALPAPRVAPPLQDRLEDALPARDWQDVQAGILSGVAANHGCALMLRFETAGELAEFLRIVPLTHLVKPFNDDGLCVNLALSIEGLRLAGFSDDELRAWPQAFYEGMARRAGLLGDVRTNHPRRWALPRRLPGGVMSADDAPGSTALPPVQLAEMHALLTLRLSREASTSQAGDRARLLAALEKWTREHQRLALQWLVRLVGVSGETTEHFGWRDAQTDPRFNRGDASTKARDHAHVGEALCGHANAADHVAPPDDAPASRWLRNGSFLVVRKLRQDVAALERAISHAADTSSLDPALLRAKLMGRWHDEADASKAGQPLVNVPPPAGNPNHFSFAGDADGRLCPLHAHIRRSNPRQPTGSLTNSPLDPSPQAPVRPPRLMRRSMSYGPTYKTAPDNADRGLFFMAYNASLAEQFELLQHWMSGANSSGGDSAQADPLLGVATPGQARTCVFHHVGALHRVQLEAASFLNEAPQPLVQLEWGAYWFAPALNIVGDIARRAGAARAVPLWNAARGEADVQHLLRIEQQEGTKAGLIAWKEALEDPESLLDYRAASIWAAIRQYHQGHLRCSYGVLVGDADGVHRVVKDESCYSATGYQERMRNSFGVIFLGHDARQPGQTYERESAGIVDRIRQLDPERTYQLARQVTHNKLAQLQTLTVNAAKEADDREWRLQFEVRELLDYLLSKLCAAWFGIDPDLADSEFDFGSLIPSADSAARPRSPGHFSSPSRYFFQPRPGHDVQRIGEAHGQALREAVLATLAKGTGSPAGQALRAAPLTAAILANPLASSDESYAARTIAGVVMGFVPTVDGTVRRALGEWLREGLFWRLRGQGPALNSFVDATTSIGGELVRAIQLRGAPELLWRTARIDHVLGHGEHAVSIAAGERVVAGLMSATQQCWEEGRADASALFGGDRDATDAPTHACPGTQAGHAVMLGFLAALLETKLALQPGPAGLSFEVSGTRERFDHPVVKSGPMSRERTTREAILPVRMMVVGDSWLAEGVLVQQSLTRALRGLGYECDSAHNLARASLTLRAVADRAAVAATLAPDVDLVLVDGGGNDVHQRTGLFFGEPMNPDWSKLTDKRQRSNLDDLLTGSGGTVDLNDTTIGRFIDAEEGLQGQMRRALSALAAVKDGPPIVVVAYDHPIPNGNAPFGAAWLAPAFKRLGLNVENDAGDLRKASDLMACLIDRLNAMNERVAQALNSTMATPKVHAIRLTGTLQGDLRLWANELHPTAEGYAQLAAALLTKLPQGVRHRQA